MFLAGRLMLPIDINHWIVRHGSISFPKNLQSCKNLSSEQAESDQFSTWFRIIEHAESEQDLIMYLNLPQTESEQDLIMYLTSPQTESEHDLIMYITFPQTESVPTLLWASWRTEPVAEVGKGEERSELQ